MSNLHVVFGHGQIGAPLARALVAQGHEVRVVSRRKAVVTGATAIVSDALDADSAVRAATGASVVYHCLDTASFSERAWRRAHPRFMMNLIAAAGDAGARLVFLDNMYAYGEVARVPFDERAAITASHGKGLVRAQINTTLLHAVLEGRVRATVGRAMDYFGPGITKSWFSRAQVATIARGRKVWFPAPLDVTHGFGFVDDIVRGLVALGTAEDDVEGKTYHLPSIVTTVRALAEAVAEVAQTSLQLRQVPPGLLRMLGAVVPLIRELGESSYQWSKPFMPDTSAFERRFGFTARSVHEAAAAAVADLSCTVLPCKQGAVSHAA